MMKARGQKEHNVPKIIVSPENEKNRKLIRWSWTFKKQKIYFVSSIISLYSCRRMA